MGQQDWDEAMSYQNWSWDLKRLWVSKTEEELCSMRVWDEAMGWLLVKSILPEFQTKGIRVHLDIQFDLIDEMFSSTTFI